MPCYPRFKLNTYAENVLIYLPKEWTNLPILKDHLFIFLNFVHKLNFVIVNLTNKTYYCLLFLV